MRLGCIDYRKRERQPACHMQVDAISISDALALMDSITVKVLLAQLDSITFIHPITKLGSVNDTHPITVQQSFALLERIAKLDPIAIAIMVGVT